jgi:hypothetical protein
MPWIRWLVSASPYKGPGLVPGSFRVEFVTEALGEIYLRVLLFSPVSISTLMLHTHLQVSPTLQNFSNGKRR